MGIYDQFLPNHSWSWYVIGHLAKTKLFLARRLSVSFCPYQFESLPASSQVFTDVCGIVAKVGSNVTGFKPGDRVVGLAGSFSSGNIDHAAYQRYTIVKSTRTGKLPQETNLQQGAAVVTAVGAASMAFFDVLGFSLPTGVDITKPRSVSPIEAILIWGGASNVGAMAIHSSL